MSHIKIHESWLPHLQTYFESDSFLKLKATLYKEKQEGHIIYPSGNQIFKAFELSTFPITKCVILGQDPYHGPNQAHGLSFSVPESIALPPSLHNIYKELETDISGFVAPTSGDLTHWANQGVLLLNASLTVRANQPNSHQQIGWHSFTDHVIAQLSKHKKHLVFMLWGKFAQEKTSLIDSQKHLIIKAVHPSPLSAHRGWFGSKCFSQCNQYLEANAIDPIHWQLG